MADDDDLTVFSWNLEKKSLGGLTSNTDNVPRLASTVRDIVEAGNTGQDKPFVGFLLEIKGSDGPRICEILKAGYRQLTGEEISATSHSTGGSAYTAESIIVLSRGVRVASRTLDVRKGLSDFVQEDRDEAIRTFGVRQQELAGRGVGGRKARAKNPYDSRADRLQKTDKPAEWFRDGVVADVTHGGETYRIASIHAPGPAVSTKVEEIGNSILKSAADEKVDVFIGDFNRRGVLPNPYFEDLSKNWTTGTTIGKNDPLQLGKTCWDRVLVAQSRTFEINSPDPVVAVRPANLALPPLTDHALVYARLRPRPAGSTPAEPVSLATPVLNFTGVDLSVFDAARTPTGPHPTPLALGAAAQQSAEVPRDPLSTPTTEPAINPLSPPSPSSPLTQPPPTDVVMQEAVTEPVSAAALSGPRPETAAAEVPF